MSIKHWLIGLGIAAGTAWAAVATVWHNPAYDWKGYEAAWKAVDSLDGLQLPRSAQEIVGEIYNHAKAEKNGPQILKSTIYRAKYVQLLEEDGTEKSMRVIEDELRVSAFPEKNILQSMLAETYWNYYTENRWKFTNRTPVADSLGGDIATWDIAALHRKTMELYTASVADREALKKISVKKYADILVSGDDYGRFLRPTLFDFLGQRAFTFLSNDEAYLTQPAYTFHIDHPVIFEDAKQFAGFTFTGNEPASMKLLAVRLLQDLTTMHLYDPYPDVLIDLNIQRYMFANNDAVVDNRDSLYLRALERDEKQYGRDSSSARITYLIAEWHHTKAAGFDRLEGKQYKTENQIALQYIDKAIAAHPEAFGTKQCQILRALILQPMLRTDTYNVNTPGAPFRLSVEYRNVDTAHIRILEATPEALAEIPRMEEDERMQAINKLKAVQQFSQVLPESGDHHTHVTEVKIDPLPYGCYFAVTASVAGAVDSGIWEISPFWVSDLAYITNSGSGYNESFKRFYVVDRTSGHPLKGVKVQTYKDDYDYFSRKYKRNNLQTYTTDANGMFEVRDPLIRDYLQFGFRLTNGKDKLESQGNFYITKQQERREQTYTNTLFFTDRSIYRPGQTIYFKGIVISSDEQGTKKEVVRAYKTTVRFYDVNSQLIAEQTLTTNDYGSFAGSFTAPVGVLTGSMRIQNEHNATYFSVEEYKRPTFKAEMDPLSGDFAVNDTVRVQGKATAYSGAVIDNAQVQYRVVRTARFPYFDHFYFRQPYYSNETEITSGTVRSDGEGKFIIPFKAAPDLSIDRASLPEFNYTVYADITDASGETRSTQTSVSIGYHSLRIDAAWKNVYANTADPYLTLHTANLNGTDLDASGTLVIYPLETPKQLYRPRIWDQPDIYLFTEKEFRTLFPKDEYRYETMPEFWKKGAATARINWNTAQQDSLQIPLKGLKTGKYRVEITAIDKNGIEISSAKTIEVLAPGAYTAVPDYLFTSTENIKSKPGENALINFGSSARDVKALVSITRGDGSVSTSWVKLTEKAGKADFGNSMDMEIPVTEADRGGMMAAIALMKDGTFHVISCNIAVPWDNKDLQVTLETHRDKLQPGAQETWKVRISGNKSEAVAAELLASMYDASLDALSGEPYWEKIRWRKNYFYSTFLSGMVGNAGSFSWRRGDPVYLYAYPSIRYDALNWFGYGPSFYYYHFRNLPGIAADGIFDGGDVMMESVMIISDKKGNAPMPVAAAVMKGFADTTFIMDEQYGAEPDEETVFAPMPLRTNFNETAFFYPQLQTDSTGSIIFSFTMPEALTTWKFMAFAHTQDLVSGSALAQVVTQKELMIQPNMPRFLREGDRIILTARVSNLTEEAISGKAQLELLNARNMQVVDAAFSNLTPSVSFTAPEKGSTVVSWEVRVPEGIDAIVYRVKAGNGTFSDGEENALPVLSNKILVTESLPLWTRGTAPKNFSFTKLLNSNASSTLRHQSVTLEYTSNPAWYAVQALPYMMEYPYECAEQVFNRYYANAIAYHIANSDPEIQRIFDSWKTNPSSLSSNLEKNQELKSLLLEETPWVLQAQNETERKKRVALLFDRNRMENEMRGAMNKLEKMQLPNGGWPWFKGNTDDRYITQYIVTGLAHLQQLGVSDQPEKARMQQMLDKAMRYCTERMEEDHRELIKNKVDLKTYVPGNLTLQYLYASSYFTDGRYPLTTAQDDARRYFLAQSAAQWTKYGLYEKGMLALIQHRNGNTKVTADIIKSLKENSLHSEEMGMYWKSNTAGYYWYQAPIETQALMVEVFGEAAADPEAVTALQVWLLRQKQTSDWKTTRATAEACYALLSRGSNLLSQKELAVISAGGTVIQPEKSELGTGYFKTNWLGTNIRPALGEVSVTPPAGSVLSYGAMYWQYFEEMDKVTTASTNLQLKKQLYLQVNTPTGPQLRSITEETPLAVGDLVKVRIELRSDRDLEYVHMKDMRASGFEPVNVMSQYKWQDGLGYYEATGDASTNFFMSRLGKGTYVFEYPVRVTHKGYFSNGITTIQCMYAPEFTSHSEGVRVVVK